MKGNKFLKRLAVTALTATMTVGAVPATAAMTATNVFAAQNVAFEANDAASNVSGLSDSISADDQKAIKAAFETATIADNTNSTAESPVTVNLTAGTLPTGYSITNCKILSATAPSMKITASGPVLVKPILHMQGDVQKDSTPKGTVTFDIEATGMTKTEKIAALKALLTTVGGSTNDATTYSNDDNSTSLNGYVNGIITSVKDTKGAPLTGNTFEGLTISATQTSITKATKSAAGSENVKVDIKATLTKGTDKDWDDTWGTAAASSHEVTDSATYTATIPKLSVTSQDSEYQQKVAAALADVKFTNEDLKYTNASDAATELTTSDANISSDTADKRNTTGVWKKVGAALNSIGIKEENYTITLRALTKASHKADGSVQILLDQKRTGDSKDAQYATVTVPITHADDTVAIGDEISAKIVALVKSYVADSKDITPTVAGEAAQKKEITAKLQAAVEKALSDTLDGTDTIASEIEKVEVSIPEGGFTASTASTNGEISKANVTVTFKDDAPLGSSLTDPGKGFWVADGTKKTQTVFEYDTAESHHATGTAPGPIKLYKVNAVAATSLTLPKETAYNTLSGTKKVKVTPTFTPAGANKYTIRWTLSDTDSFTFKDSGAYDSYTEHTDDHKVTATNKTAFLANDGITMDASSVDPGDTATLTAELIDSDGLVAAKASTTLKAVQGFSDVQNKYDYAYKAITNMTQPEIVIKNGKAEKVAVISGVGDNKFDPDADVTRAQFVTFLYRLAQLQSTPATAKAENANDDAHIGLVDLKDDSDNFKSFPSFTDAKAQTKFTDVAAGAYYAKAVDWAVANGIAAGKTATTFDPNAVVTRAEAVTFLQRYFAAGQKYNVSSKFVDVKSTDFFADAVGWATANGVTQGKDETHFAPKDTATRKEAAAFIYRALRASVTIDK